MIIYEAHTGTFTPQGDFSSMALRLDHLESLGINTLLLMPVAQFSGKRGWGYLTVFPFAVHNAYAPPNSLKELIRECHRRGIGVVLDLAFSCVPPEANSFSDLAPFKSPCYNSDWGPAINFDSSFSYGIREFYIQGALSWLRDYRIDGLKISCTDRIIDRSPVHFLSELSERVEDFSRSTGKTISLTAEDACGSLAPIRDRIMGGYGFHALCSDEFHNAIFPPLAGEADGLYSEYTDCCKIAKSLQNGRCFSGEFSKTRMNYHGHPAETKAGGKYVVYNLNHRLAGRSPGKSRTIKSAGLKGAKLAAGATLLTPFIPMIFMGEEFAAENCFHFFCSPEAKETDLPFFQSIKEETALYCPLTEIPVPEADITFNGSKICWSQASRDEGQCILSLHRDLIRLRRETPALAIPCSERTQVHTISPEVFLLLRNCGGQSSSVAALFNFSDTEKKSDLSNILPGKVWSTKLCSEQEKYGGELKDLPLATPDTKYPIPPKSFSILSNISPASL